MNIASAILIEIYECKRFEWPALVSVSKYLISSLIMAKEAWSSHLNALNELRSDGYSYKSLYTFLFDSPFFIDVAYLIMVITFRQVNIDGRYSKIS